MYRIPKPTALSGTVIVLRAAPPFDQPLNVQTCPVESVCCAGAVKVCESPTAQMKL